MARKKKKRNKPPTVRQLLGLNTARYVRLHQRVLREEPECRICLAQGHITASVEVDHILPIATHPELALVRENLRALCKKCHKDITREFNTKHVEPEYCKHGFRVDVEAGSWACPKGCPIKQKEDDT